MEIVYYVATSLDGYIATPDGGVGWLDTFNDPDIDYGFEDFYASVDAIVMGSGTYEFSLTQDEWMAPDTPTWVFTKRDLPLLDPGITLTSDSPASIVTEMSGKGLKSAWLMGGGKLATSFRQAGLITRYVVSFMPVILGEGIPLFAPGGTLDALELVEGKVFPNYVVMFIYEPADEAFEAFDSFEPAEDNQGEDEIAGS